MEKRATTSRGAESAWLHLQMTLQNQRNAILSSEERNTQHIHLYGFGDYWAAFEQSAYRLQQLFPESEVSVIYLKNYPVPMAMAAVADSDLCTFKKEHIYRTVNPDHLVFAVAPIRPNDFYAWKREAIRAMSY